jgi:hypothetical protein
MSTSFTNDLPRAEKAMESAPCLCAQMVEAFSRMFHGEDNAEIRSDLAREARGDCPSCHGTGVEEVPAEIYDRTLSLNFATGNALPLLGALGLPREPYGECTIAEAKRALLRASNVSLESYTRATEIHYGAPCEQDDGTIELKPVRLHIKGLSVQDLARRVAEFAAFVRASAEAGASKILWG